MQVIILLYIIKLAFGWEDPVTIGWTGGTRVYDDLTQNTNECPVTQYDDSNNPIQPCLVEASHKFYAPFHGSSSRGIYFEIEARCPYYGTVDISYKVATCDVIQSPIDKKAKTILFFNGMNEVGRGAYGLGAANSEPLTDAEDIAALTAKTNGVCTSWTSTSFQFLGQGPVVGNQIFPIRIRNRISGSNQYESLYDWTIICNDERSNCDGDGCVNNDNSETLGHFCVDISNLPAGQEKYSGEYRHIETSEINGLPVFENDSPNGITYLVASTTDGNWVIVDNKDDTTYKYRIICPGPPDFDILHIGFPEECTFSSDAVGLVEGSVVNGECNDVIVGNIFGISDETKIILMLVILSLSSCIFGMMTLYCCQLICYNRNKNYKKVASKDFDIDF